MIIADVVKILIPSTVAFTIGVLLTPIVTHYLYQWRAWKKTPGKIAMDGTEAVEFNRLHKETERTTPRMGGIVIWASSFITITGIWALAQFSTIAAFDKLDFLSRGQTWLPLFTLMLGALVGLINDVFDITGTRGLGLRARLIIVASAAAFVGWWFFEKLEVSSVSIPFNGSWELGVLFIPFFVIVTVFLYAGGIIDGIDGLAGGVFAAIFAAYGGVAFYLQQINLAAFSLMVTGSILAFLWFNIPPARFYMTETGTMGLTMTLAVIAFMTDEIGGGSGVAALLIIALPLIVTVCSNVIQVTSKRFRGKKVFRVAPLHHHFEAIGWPGYKVTMRYWVISIVAAVLGMSIAIVA